MKRPEDVTMDDALADVARVGPYFAVGTDPGIADHPLWRPLTALYGPALPDQIATVRVRLGTAEERVAASLLFQGVAGRLWSPALATAVLHGRVPELDPASTYWRAASPGPVLLAAPGAPASAADAAALRRVIVDGHLVPLVRAVRAVTPVAEGLLWGNAASALAGALTVLALARPERSAAASRLVGELLATPPLRAAGDLGPYGFRRRSCCLYYRVPGGGKCADCALLSTATVTPPVTSQDRRIGHPPGNVDAEQATTTARCVGDQ
ncbi:(2Fe-2S)-binding protein [Actinoallomurus spadix]|uniref:(2Fe-2S)-binding protein n=1 Tax=Actinoallomurus spadix TaxID=79912 RepID=A0ABP3GGH8_9ACTN|nr:(2Fe-2S)-binding protein [Actinoallomurus spadix]MCO5988264.1 (2Fe-2S)-binding protein [Actinoallomurus spadix]